MLWYRGTASNKYYNLYKKSVHNKSAYNMLLHQQVKKAIAGNTVRGSGRKIKNMKSHRKRIEEVKVSPIIDSEEIWVI